MALKSHPLGFLIFDVKTNHYCNVERKGKERKGKERKGDAKCLTLQGEEKGRGGKKERFGGERDILCSELHLRGFDYRL